MNKHKEAELARMLRRNEKLYTMIGKIDAKIRKDTGVYTTVA